MASALGAALIMPPLQALSVFAALGFGLALPFLLMALVPALQRRLPKPGPWMLSLQRLLSIPMFLTALWLAWVLGRQAGIDALTLALAAVLVVSLWLWWIGHRQRQSQPTRLLPMLCATALSASPIAFVPTVANTTAQASHRQATEPFSEARLLQLRQAGTPVFVDFTADWCLTCKVNEKAAIERDEVQVAFAQRGIVTLVGDWSGGNPGITAFLAKHGRNSIPFYVYYGPGKRPLVLPQLLTVKTLVDLTKTDQSGRSAQPRT
jgi:thiol:disulfide interchange protein